MERTPFLIVGDGPQEPTGLGRIARDLAARLVQSELPVQVISIGGSVPPVWTAWPHFPLNPANEDWGAAQVEAYYQDLWGTRPGILFVVWDPGRLYPYVGLHLPVQKWAYTAIDAVNLRGTLGGPAAHALTRFDRVLAYGRFGGQALRPLLGPTPYLPHGIDTAVYAAPPTPEEETWVTAQLGAFYRPGMPIIGFVATNQPRKDFALFFQTLQRLRERGHNVYAWVHTDMLVAKAWSIPQLVEDTGLEKRVTVTGTDAPLTDRQMALLYQRCALQLQTTNGEGYGYGIVESLAAGTPVVHGDYAGGAELVPSTAWRVPVQAWRVESVYALQRPVFKVDDVANAAERVLRWTEAVGPATSAAYCRGAVAHLDWQVLWPRWRAWFRQGLEGR